MIELGRLRCPIFATVRVLAVTMLAASCATTEQASNRIDKIFSDREIRACRNLVLLPSLTVTASGVIEKSAGVPAHCYVKGQISESITWHAQLPARKNWSGRLVHQGDGGSDGHLGFRPDPNTDSWLRFGDAVANSNSGHDAGIGPNWALHNRQSEVDFGYRAVHLTVEATKTLVEAYYRRPPEFVYHVGCSNGGRQGLMAAQRFPQDFDGIVAGAPSIFRAANFYHHLRLMQHVFRDDMAANPAWDSDGNGKPDSLGKIDMLHEAVLGHCDDKDGIRDRIIDDPLQCDFDVDAFLVSNRCPDDVDAGNCFTAAQSGYVRHLYDGSHNDAGDKVYPGVTFGSEYLWDRFIPVEGNDLTPYVLRSIIRVFQSMFDEDPGIAPARVNDTSYSVKADGAVPEWAWWDYDPEKIFEDSKEMSRLIDPVDPDLRRFLVDNGGKLIIYQGWDEPYHSAEVLLNYVDEIVEISLGGDEQAARDSVRLFMMPGVQHCFYGPGPDLWERFEPVKHWVEAGEAPDKIVTQKIPFDVVINERILCPWPQKARYTGPAELADDPSMWHSGNFVCE